ncbi:MAG: glycosyltransferase family 4 protein [Anaerolineae bacterium]|nr:glycosyltransferase family 4 protein [Anaerolineae bacterium]
MTRLAFVVPRYGPDVLGGAETFARRFAAHLPRDQFAVTVLTTCARDLLSWRNEIAAGESEIDGLRVLRFPVDHRHRDARLFQKLADRANRGEPLSPDDQAAWLENAPHSPDLYQHVANHGDDYDQFIFLPYLFGTTLYGSAIWPDKTVICPCLHDEPYAYFTDVRAMLRSARGLMFISQPERTFAEEKLGVDHPRARVVGFGLDEFETDAERFRQKFGLHAPFLLYAGRLDPAKNVLQLVSSFLAYRQTRPDRELKLVLAGSGPLPLPSHPDLLALGYLEGQDLRDAYGAATVFCQPSLVESFSIVLMEAWLAGTAVLVHGQCPVTRHHVLQSNGGLYFTSAAEFAGALDWFLDHPQQRQQMAALGRAYVRRECNWPRVRDRFRHSVSMWRFTSA